MVGNGHLGILYTEQYQSMKKKAKIKVSKKKQSKERDTKLPGSRTTKLTNKEFFYIAEKKAHKQSKNLAPLTMPIFKHEAKALIKLAQATGNPGRETALMIIIQYAMAGTAGSTEKLEGLDLIKAGLKKIKAKWRI